MKNLKASCWVPLPRAAQLLRRSLAGTIALIKSGPLKARLCAGRWFVLEDSVRTFRRHRRTGVGAA